VQYFDLIWENSVLHTRNLTKRHLEGCCISIQHLNVHNSFFFMLCLFNKVLLTSGRHFDFSKSTRMFLWLSYIVAYLQSLPCKGSTCPNIHSLMIELTRNISHIYIFKSLPAKESINRLKKNTNTSKVHNFRKEIQFKILHYGFCSA
jgi:hypothetical protein